MQRACLLCDNSSLEVRTGCVIFKNGRVIGEGWSDDSVHAEVMAVESAKESDTNLDGSSVFISRFPCLDCAEMLIEERIAGVLYMSNHFTSGNAAFHILEANKIKVIQIPEKVVWEREK